MPSDHRYTVFRESCCDAQGGAAQATLAVWFHLRGIPPGSRLRRLLFERLSLVNTLLFAGFAGYVVKLWMVDPPTADFAGLYTWRCAEEAETYAEYITRVLSPLSVPGSTGYRLLPGSIDDYLTSGTGRRRGRGAPDEGLFGDGAITARPSSVTCRSDAGSSARTPRTA